MDAAKVAAVLDAETSTNSAGNVPNNLDSSSSSAVQRWTQGSVASGQAAGLPLVPENRTSERQNRSAKVASRRGKSVRVSEVNPIEEASITSSTAVIADYFRDKAAWRDQKAHSIPAVMCPRRMR
jgi:hypothetical protein